MLYTDFIKGILSEASEIANKNFGKVSGTVKGNDSNQIVTEIDFKIGNLIIEKIKASFPEYNIIDEEAGVINNNSEFTWVVDPIDGTSNYAIGVPTYGIMLGLLKNTTPVAGGIALPYFKELYTAEKGGGAYRNGEKIEVTKETELIKVAVAYGIDSHREKPEFTRKETKLLGEIILNVRNFRVSNSVFDTVLVASGKYGANLNQTSKIWDNVGQQIIIEEAGGVYTDYFGNPIDYKNPIARANENYTFCAAPPALHKKLQEIIKNNRLD